MKEIFISHRSLDKDIADIFVNFLCSIGINSEMIFCSSLPGNDVQWEINSEIKEYLQTSKVDIIIISQNYYNSAYCLNESGIIWYNNKKIIVIALPNVDESNMLGFISNDNKLRRLDLESDLFAVYDLLKEVFVFNISITKLSEYVKKIVTEYNNLLDKKSYNILANSKVIESKKGSIDISTFTDEEIIVFYYSKMNRIHILDLKDFLNWIFYNELKLFNAYQTFSLLSKRGLGILKNNTLDMNINIYIKLINCDDTILESTYQKFISLTSNRFIQLYKDDCFDDVEKLFFLYIIEEKISDFDDSGEFEQSIESWEDKNHMENIVSNKYYKGINALQENQLIYEQYPHEFTLCKSIKDFLFSDDNSITQDLIQIRKKYTYFR